MREFFTGIVSTAKGYTVGVGQMNFTPGGVAVTALRIGCGGSEKRKATFIDVIAWGTTAEKLNELVTGKGLAVRAEGMVSQRKWQYSDKWYERLELVYLKSLAVQVGNELVEIPIEGRRPDGKGETEGLQSSAEPISEEEASALSKKEAEALVTAEKKK